MKRTHGHTNPKSHEYRAWVNMRSRVKSEHPRYGGRGIKVCPQWQTSFESFLADVGLAPTPKHTLDRYPNNDGDYEPGNVRWATRHEQNANKCSNHLLTAFGRTQHVAEWARESGLHIQTVLWRLRHGWSAERALGPEDNRATTEHNRGADGRFA